MLSKRDLLLAAVARKKVDRIPVTMWRHFPIEDQTPDGFLDVTFEFQNAYDWDLIKVMPSWMYHIEDYGATSEYDGNMIGIVAHPKPTVASIEQWEALKPLDVHKGALGRELSNLRKIAERAGDTPFIQTVFNPLMCAMELTGSQYLVWMRKYPEAFKRGLQVITDNWTRYTAEVMKTGAAGLFFATMQASYNVMSEADYKRWGHPYDLEVLGATKGGWFNMLHLHGQALMFEAFKDYPVQAVNWYDRDTAPSLKDGKDLFPGAVLGGVDHNRTMLLKGPDALRAEIADALAQTGGVGHILGPGCGVPIGVGGGNYRAVAAAARAAR